MAIEGLYGRNLTQLQGMVGDRAGTVPNISEIVKPVVNEMFSKLSWLPSVLKAIGWTVLVYFFLLIIFAFVRFIRGRKQTKLLVEMNKTLKEIRDRLPKRKGKKEE